VLVGLDNHRTTGRITHIAQIIATYTRSRKRGRVWWLWFSFEVITFILLLFWHAPPGVHGAKRRHQSPEWTILSHVSCFIQEKVIGFQAGLSLSPHPGNRLIPNCFHRHHWTQALVQSWVRLFWYNRTVVISLSVLGVIEPICIVIIRSVIITALRQWKCLETANKRLFIAFKHQPNNGLQLLTCLVVVECDLLMSTAPLHSWNRGHT